jgi:hypothetical protein
LSGYLCLCLAALDAAVQGREKRYGREQADKGDLSSSESIYAFVAWMSSRPESEAIGADIEVPPWPELIKEFCEANGLPEPRESWPHYLTNPRACQAEKNHLSGTVPERCSVGETARNKGLAGGS